LLGDSIQAEKLAEAYEGLNASMLHEMDDFDDNLDARDHQPMKKTPRLPK
jgi:hypothetical protein